ALARDAKLPAYFLQCPRIAVAKTKAQLEHTPLAFRQTGEDVAQLILEQAEARCLGRVFSRLVLDEIAEMAVLSVPNGGRPRSGLLRHFEHRPDAFDRHLHVLGQ